MVLQPALHSVAARLLVRAELHHEGVDVAGKGRVARAVRGVAAGVRGLQMIVVVTHSGHMIVVVIVCHYENQWPQSDG